MTKEDICSYDPCYRESEYHHVVTIKGFLFHAPLCEEHKDLFRKEFPRRDL